MTNHYYTIRVHQTRRLSYMKIFSSSTLIRFFFFETITHSMHLYNVSTQQSHVCINISILISRIIVLIYTRGFNMMFCNLYGHIYLIERINNRKFFVFFFHSSLLVFLSHHLAAFKRDIV